MTRHASILRREVYLAFYVEDHPMFQNINDGPIKWLLLRKEKKNL
jgi:hypothetical protein